MSRVVPVMGIVASVLGFMAALIFVELALLLPAVFALGAGITLIVVGKHDWKIWGTASVALVFAILGIMGVLTNISTEDGGLDLFIPYTLGQAFVVAAMFEIAGASVMTLWDDGSPQWLRYVWLGVWVLGFLLAIIFRADLSFQAEAPAYIIGFLSLAMMGAPIQALRQG